MPNKHAALFNVSNEYSVSFNFSDNSCHMDNQQQPGPANLAFRNSFRNRPSAISDFDAYCTVFPDKSVKRNRSEAKKIKADALAYGCLHTADNVASNHVFS